MAQTKSAQNHLRCHAFIYSRFSILYLLVLLPTGCNLLGFVADKSDMGKDRAALYTLSQESTVVIAENWNNPTGTALDAEQLERDVFETLRSHNLGTQVNPTEVIDLRSRRSDYATMSIAQIGKLVGARQIIYVNITGLELVGATGSDAYTGKATVRVKVVDADSGTTRWPIDNADGFPIKVTTNLVTASDASDKTALREKLLQATADRIAQLFYTAPAPEE